MKKTILLVLSVLLVASIVSATSYMNALSANNYMSVTFVNQNPDPVEPGQFVELRFKFENWGSETAEAVSVEILPEFPFSLGAGVDSIQNIGSIQPRQTGDKGVIVKYKLKVDEDAVEGENEIKIRYRSTQNSYPTGWIELDPFTVDIQTHDAIISIDSVELNPEELAPGEIGELTLTLRNLADSVLKEIKTKLDVRETQTVDTVTTNDYPFSPIGSTNEKTLATLLSGEAVEIKFNLMASPDAEANLYKVPLKIDYSDELGKNYSKDLIVGLLIGEEPDLVVNLDSTTIKSSGNKGTVTLRLVNKGTNNIKFCYVTLEEDNYKVLSPPNTYIGKIESDDYETVDFDIHVPKKESEVNLILNVEYKDANNKDFNKKIEVPLPLYTAAEAKQYGVTQGNGAVGIFIVIIIVGVGIFFYWRWKRKNKVKK